MDFYHKKIAKLTFWSFIVTIFFGTAINAQYSMSGPIGATLGQTKTYSVIGSNIFQTSWSTGSQGSIQTSTNPGTTTIQVQWNSTGSSYVRVDVVDYFYNSHFVQKSVSVTQPAPTTPGNPTITSNGCGQATLTRSGSPPSNVTWYWQGKSSSGTSTSKGSGSTFTANEGTGTYYIRARNSSGVWSSSSGSRYVSMVNLTAGSINGAQTICYSGNPSTLGNSASAGGISGSYSYQWQYSSNGSSGWTNISGATSSTYNPPGGLTASRWYRRRVSCASQTSYTGSVKVTVASTPGTPSSPTITNNCGNTVLTRTSPPSGITWYWQSSSSGTSTSNSNTSVTRTSGTTYYLRGRNSSGCWGSSRTVSYSVTQPTTWYADTDGDGYGNSSVSTSSCSQPSAYVSNSSDHDDTTVMITNIAPQTFYSDADGDGFGDGATTLYASFKPLGYANNSSDQCPERPGPNNGCDYVAPTPSDENYVSTRSYQMAMSSSSSIQRNSDVLESVSYFDGLGRTTQQVSVKASGTATRAASPNAPAEWTMDWTAGTGSTNFFNRNGTIAENERFYGPNPFGETDLIWQCGNEPDHGSDGGWNTDYFNVDKTKTYRYMVWMRRDQSNNGSSYHGTQNVNNLSGSANSNPYFWYGDPPQLGEWYLLVGIIHPYTHGSTDTGVSGVYDMQGNRVIDGTEFKWRSDTTTSRFRSYLYYCTDVNVRQYFYQPILEVVDGNEIPLQEMFTVGKNEDVLTHMSYDAFGRQDKEWLPYHKSTGNLGSYRGDVSTEIQQYYKDNYASDFPGVSNVADINAYAEKALEASPLNRVLEQAAPGKDWKMGNGHTIHFDYLNNTANEVRRYRVTLSFANNTYTPTLAPDGYYGADELYKNVTKDENWTSGTDHTTEEFTDKQGRVVLKRTYNSGAHDTYYVYDEYGNLTYVLPPKVVHDSSISATELSELCYQYVYDHRNRLVEKKIPGKGWEFIVYDKLDRPIMSQDANLDAQNKWLFTKYDPFGRVAYSGLSNTTTSSRTALQNTVNGLSTHYVTKSSSSITIAGTTIYYNNGVYPTGISEVHTINYYDSYADTDGLSVPGTVLGQSTASGASLKGLATVSKVLVLTTNDWITTITGYDSKRRPIYTASKNNYLNTTDIVETKLDFPGKPLETKTTHTKDSNTAIVTTDIFDYDHMGRLLVQNQNIDGKTETLVQNSYDAIGQLINKKVGGSLDYEAPTLVDQVEVTASGNQISTTHSTSGWGNSGFASSKVIQRDGYVEWRVSSTNKYFMVGLSSDNPNANYTTIDYALYMRAGELRVYESGSNKGTFGTYQTDDIFRIERYGDTVRYLHNNELVYTSTVTNTQSLMVDAAFSSTGSIIEDLRIEDADAVVKATPLQTIDYDYNVRGWLKQINNPNNLGGDLFAFDLNYNTADHSGTPLFNGNIAETEWKTANDNALRWYRYDYDPLNRLEAATANSTNYHVSGISYDKNGNILTLTRKGHTNAGATSFGTMDNLVYTYDSGNKLTKVLDNGNDTYGFADGANTSTEYTYDANGNMLTDANKGISSNIGYNHLNLPTSVTLGGGTISYIYDATGVKLKKTAGSSVTEYAGNYVYSGNTTSTTLQFFNHPEGYVYKDGSNYNYVYQYKDHLGNIRLSYEDGNDNGNVDASEIVEENNYYPFGLKHKGYNSSTSSLGNSVANRWRYNGIELDETTELYEMKLRQYDPAIARWTSIDPVTHYSASTYNAFDNNPIFFADPSGANSTAEWMKANGITQDDLITIYQAPSDEGNADGSPNESETNEDCCGKYIGSYAHKMGPKEQRYYRNNPDKKEIVSKAAFKAGVLATKVSDDLGGDNLGYSGAIRHSYWMYLLAVELGPELAEKLGMLHEDYIVTVGEHKGRNNLTSRDSEMDQVNNAFGITIARKNPNLTDLEFEEVFFKTVNSKRYQKLIRILDTKTIPKESLNDRNARRNKEIVEAWKARDPRYYRD